MSLLLPDSGLLFWMLLSFGVVFVVLAKYGFPVITKMVEGRKTYIDQSLVCRSVCDIHHCDTLYFDLYRYGWIECLVVHCRVE